MEVEKRATTWYDATSSVWRRSFLARSFIGLLRTVLPGAQLFVINGYMQVISLCYVQACMGLYVYVVHACLVCVQACMSMWCMHALCVWVCADIVCLCVL